MPVEPALNRWKTPVCAGSMSSPANTLSLVEDGRYQRLLDLMGHARQESLGLMAFSYTCRGFCCAPAVCRCACNGPASGR